MSIGTLAPVPRQEFFDNDGQPLAGGLLYFSQSGSAFATDPLLVYQDADLTVPWSNPLELDADGRATYYLQPTSYRIAVHDADDALMYTVDPMQATNIGSSTGLGEQFVFGGDPTSPVTLTAYPSGSTYDKCHAGTAFWTLDSADLAAGVYVLEAMGLMNAAGTLSVAIVNLSDGAPDVPLAVATFTSTTGESAQSGAITFAAAGADKTYAIKTKVSANSGEAWMIRVTRLS